MSEITYEPLEAVMNSLDDADVPERNRHLWTEDGIIEGPTDKDELIKRKVVRR